jgi:hypothetical protein
MAKKLSNNIEELSIEDRLLKKIYAYSETIWREKWEDGADQEWLSNFNDGTEDEIAKQKLNMLYLLSKFMYFGNKELRQLLSSLYRDLFKYPIVASIRKANGDTIDDRFIEEEFQKEQKQTRFLGVGNPSESGVHMLYYFRQECGLPKDYFINTSDIFKTEEVKEKESDAADARVIRYLKSSIRNPVVRRYIFIDDFCGSGSQASEYLSEIVKNIKAEDDTIEVNYLTLFATAGGMDTVRKLGVFSKVESVFCLDDTFKAFSDDSRYFNNVPDAEIEKTFSKTTAHKYGDKISMVSLGYRDGQLLLGLYHNTPDNSLPIFWSDEKNWKPMFKRYIKYYNV